MSCGLIGLDAVGIRGRAAMWHCAMWHCRVWQIDSTPNQSR